MFTKKKRMKIIYGISFLSFLAPLVGALNGFYYQILTSPDVQQRMQANLSCLTAMFDISTHERGFFMFSGYNNASQKIHKFQGELIRHLRSNNCYQMTNSGPHAGRGICIFSADPQDEYIVATNSQFTSVFVLSLSQPDSFTGEKKNEGLQVINQTLGYYNLTTELVETPHRDCFFYPPKNIDYAFSKNKKRPVQIP